MTEPEPLSVKIEALNGNVYTFGARESDAGSVPYDISWGTQNPGGFADASVTLMRSPWFSSEEIPLFATVTISGNEVKYKGRLRSAPRGDSESVTLELEGLSAQLDDNSFWMMLGVHNDFGEWQGPAVQRQINLAAVNITPQANVNVEQDTTGLSALATRLDGTWATTAGATCEAWLDTANMPIGSIYYSWKRSADINSADVLWNWFVMLSDDDVLTTLNSSGNLRAAGPGSGSVTAGGTRSFATVQMYYADDVATAVGLSTIWWLGLSVFGDHGLTPTAIGDGRYGLETGDVVFFCIADNSIEAEYIEETTFVAPHVVHEGTPRELIEEMSAFGLDDGTIPDWGFYENGFFWRSADSHGRTWRVNRNQMATATDEGPDSDALCKAVVITYTDGAGKQLSVGPPFSGADYETGDLWDTTEANRAPTERIKVRDAGITTQGGAVLIGQALLRESNNQPRKGAVTITGDIENDAGGIGHASDVRACDRIVIVDDEEPEEQRIVSTSYNHTDQICTANVGVAPANIETLLARLAAVTPA
jgi:hypothetical protein